MNLNLIFLSIGLAMDAFAVAICKGLGMNKINYKHAFIIALMFGLFQGMMPLIGWAVGSRFASYVSVFSGWIAFILLAIIGAKMIYEAVKEDQAVCKTDNQFSLKEIVVLSIATSIDALAVGISLALVPDVDIIVSVATIGIITFIISLVGVGLGNKIGCRFNKYAEFAGGIILIIIGIKMLIENL